ncbi:hypothetical protein Mesil_1770 [Allomeiothermus silvanus DSM 9946]|uniref:Uncharacterized protein n=1 Tax=Allomeiothermus silvanus (strain ATCC 700542 / DSM 9946 / NBRC 106475 / NCIMB 13440 / VI-R2) TaxID=526227 RepID=D7BFU5_ALLS1|nr:hypothetical protein [Allomeiothermus silvanus]ADH63648.1 hypothetical protein Mesil_1770 [Allomeiothermus silvanus DSM 9946]
MNYLVLGLGLGVFAIGGYLFLEARKTKPQPPAPDPILSNPDNRDAYDDYRKGERDSWG